MIDINLCKYGKVKMLRYMDDPVGVKCWGKAVPEIVMFGSLGIHYMQRMVTLTECDCFFNVFSLV